MKQSTSNSSKQNQTQPTSIEVWPSSPCLKWKKVILWHPTILFSLFSIQPFSRCSSDTWMWLHWVACLLYNVLCVCSYYHVNSLGSCRSIEERKWSFCEYFQLGIILPFSLTPCLLVSYWTQLGSSASTNTIGFPIKPSATLLALHELFLNLSISSKDHCFPPQEGGWVGCFLVC